MDINFCVIIGIIFFIVVILTVRAVLKYIEKSDSGQLANVAVLLLFAVAPGYLFFCSFNQLIALPVISSCDMVVTQRGDTLYEFQDATRYCRAIIEKTDTTTVFVTRKEKACLGLSRSDSCLYCHRPLCEHSRFQRIDTGNINDDWGWNYIPY